jgi:hypothetical protein
MSSHIDQYIKAIECHQKLLSKLLNSSTPIFNLKSYSQFVQKPFPVVCIAENDGSFECINSAGEYRTDHPLQLGVHIQKLATDTKENAKQLNQFLSEQGLHNVDVVLINDLREAVVNNKQLEPVASSTKPHVHNLNQAYERNSTINPLPVHQVADQIIAKDRQWRRFEKTMTTISAFVLTAPIAGIIKAVGGMIQALVNSYHYIASRLSSRYEELSAQDQIQLDHYQEHIKHGLANIGSGFAESIPPIGLMRYCFQRWAYNDSQFVEYKRFMPDG